MALYRRRTSRRTRLIILAVLAPIALVAWQANAATGVQVAAQRTQSAASAPLEKAERLVEGRSAVLADLYASKEFDPYVQTWLAGQSTTRAYQEDCAAAEERVFLPPFAQRVTESCEDLLGGGEVTRLNAFVPVLTRFLRACRDQDTVRTEPYDQAQWDALGDVVDKAVKTDCDQQAPLTV